MRATDAGSGVDPSSIVALLDKKLVKTTFTADDPHPGGEGRHALVLRVGDFQETKNMEDVAKILPTATLRVSVRVPSSSGRARRSSAAPRDPLDRPGEIVIRLIPDNAQMDLRRMLCCSDAAWSCRRSRRARPDGGHSVATRRAIAASSTRAIRLMPRG